MNLFGAFLIGVALSVDTMAVAAVTGARHPRLPIKKAVQIAFVFGLFHFLMPLVGWILGVGLEKIISSFDHWVAFVLLGVVGAKMVYATFQHHEEAQDSSASSFRTLMILATACSIDALVVGMTFGLVPVALVPTVITIGLTTFVLSFSSVYIGKKFGETWSSKTEMFGGLILIGIGIKILFDHMM